MNILPLVDVNDTENLTEMRNIMKNFKCMTSPNAVEIKDVSDVQNILEEGRIEDLTKCIQGVLNYNFRTCANDSTIKIKDPTFVNAFRVAQFIIRFLLYWKTELLRRHSKFNIQCQELDKLRKECFVRKMENKELRKQLIKSQQTFSSNINNGISDCQRCKKMFINSSLHYAHHKKRQSDLPFVNPKDTNEMQALRDEIVVLKYQLQKVSSRKANEGKSNEIDEPKAGITSLKMILTPESGCLEAQEKFWRGKVKELQRSLDELTAENSSLKKQLTNLKNIATCSVAVQTEFSYLILKNSIKDFLSDAEEKSSVNFDVGHPAPSTKFPRSVPVSRTSTNLNYISNDENMDSIYLKSKLFMAEESCPSTTFPYDILTGLPSSRLCSPVLRDQKSDFAVNSTLFPMSSAIKHSYLKENLKKNSLRNETTFLDKTDIIEEVDSFLQNYDKLKSKHDQDSRTKSDQVLLGKADIGNKGADVQQVITKLFTVDSSSELLADKLIKIYEKRRSLVTDEDDMPDADVVKLSSDTRLAEKEVKSSISNSTEDLFPANSNGNNGHRVGAEQSCSPANLESVFEGERNETVIEENLSKNHREKLRFLPFFRNIQSKIIKNYSKSRKTCASIIETKGTRKIPVAHLKNSDNLSNCVSSKNELHTVNEQPSHNQNQSHECEVNDSCLPESNANIDLNEHKLISAMKKSKSTGNITKKVAFMDELPTFKTVSESDLRKITDAVNHRNSNPHESKTAASADTLRDNLNKPIPAPRSKKNVTLTRSSPSNFECGKQTSKLQENMNY